MNESETRAEYIDPQLAAAGWGVVTDSKILRERDVCKITDGRIQSGGQRAKPLIADYILVYKGIKLAIVEAKSREINVSEGVAQAKLYAQKLNLNDSYSANGRDIYYIDLQTGEEKLVDRFMTPDELWQKTYPEKSISGNAEIWREKFAGIPFEDKSGTWQPRYYQELAVKKTLESVAQGKDRILLTLATGTGKTAIAFQIAWKLFHTRWNLSARSEKFLARRPRILFLADRNILANQAFNSFSAFPEDALVRISPREIRKTGKVPTNGSIFFTIFQSFMTKNNAEEIDDDEILEAKDIEYRFGEYPKDYFDFIIIDECHRGGANDEGNWRAILDYFSPAVQLGLTATPKRKDNVDTYKYFGEPIYIYSLKEGINDGFLTPFKVKRIKTTIDDYRYTSDDSIIHGDIDYDKLYEESDFNKNIEIREREEYRVKTFMKDSGIDEKAIIFCATQVHAAMVRDIVNQNKPTGKDINYCVRVTANDGEIGEQFLREFQDNEKLIPTILTTSQKLSTGVDARNIRNIVLMRPVNSMIEFKQIVGRGTRLFDGKEFFTIYDFVDAYKHFSDPEWDGEPIEPVICDKCESDPCVCEKKPKKCKICGETPCVCDIEPPTECETCGKLPCICIKKVKIKLNNGKELEIQHTIQTSFWSADGKPISSEEFLQNLFGELPNLFKSESELRELWSNPETRKKLLEKLAEAGFDLKALNNLKKLVNAEKSDIFDVLEYVFNSDIKPISRQKRVEISRDKILENLTKEEVSFIEFILEKYIEVGIGELDSSKLPILLASRFRSQHEGIRKLGGNVSQIRTIFIDFQKKLYLTK